jgi:hypothetical protein
MAQFSQSRERLGNRLAFNCFVTGPFVVFLPVLIVVLLIGLFPLIAGDWDYWGLFLAADGARWAAAIATGLLAFLFFLNEAPPIRRQRRRRRRVRSDKDQDAPTEDMPWPGIPNSKI